MLDSYRICDFIDDCIMNITENGRLFLSILRQRAANSPALNPFKVHCFDKSQDIDGYFISMFIREDHPLRQQISAITERAFESGLFVKWAMDTTLELRSKCVPDHHVASALQVTHIAGGLSIHVLCMVLCTIIFFFERTAFQKLQQNQRNRLWKTIEIFVDGNRHYWQTIGPIVGKPKNNNKRKVPKRKPKQSSTFSL